MTCVGEAGRMERQRLRGVRRTGCFDARNIRPPGATTVADGLERGAAGGGHVNDSTGLLAERRGDLGGTRHATPAYCVTTPTPVPCYDPPLAPLSSEVHARRDRHRHELLEQQLARVGNGDLRDLRLVLAPVASTHPARRRGERAVEQQQQEGGGGAAAAEH